MSNFACEALASAGIPFTRPKILEVAYANALIVEQEGWAAAHLYKPIEGDPIPSAADLPTSTPAHSPGSPVSTVEARWRLAIRLALSIKDLGLRRDAIGQIALHQQMAGRSQDAIDSLQMLGNIDRDSLLKRMADMAIERQDMSNALALLEKMQSDQERSTFILQRFFQKMPLSDRDCRLLGSFLLRINPPYDVYKRFAIKSEMARWSRELHLNSKVMWQETIDEWRTMESPRYQQEVFTSLVKAQLEFGDLQGAEQSLTFPVPELERNLAQLAVVQRLVLEKDFLSSERIARDMTNLDLQVAALTCVIEELGKQSLQSEDLLTFALQQAYKAAAEHDVSVALERVASVMVHLNKFPQALSIALSVDKMDRPGIVAEVIALQAENGDRPGAEMAVRKLTDPINQVYAQIHLARAVSEKDKPSSMHLLSEALDSADQVKDPVENIAILGRIATAYAAMGETEKVIKVPTMKKYEVYLELLNSALKRNDYGTAHAALYRMNPWESDEALRKVAAHAMARGDWMEVSKIIPLYRRPEQRDALRKELYRRLIGESLLTKGQGSINAERIIESVESSSEKAVGLKELVNALVNTGRIADAQRVVGAMSYGQEKVSATAIIRASEMTTADFSTAIVELNEIDPLFREKALAEFAVALALHSLDGAAEISTQTMSRQYIEPLTESPDAPLIGLKELMGHADASTLASGQVETWLNQIIWENGIRSSKSQGPYTFTIYIGHFPSITSSERKHLETVQLLVIRRERLIVSAAIRAGGPRNDAWDPINRSIYSELPSDALEWVKSKMLLEREDGWHHPGTEEFNVYWPYVFDDDDSHRLAQDMRATTIGRVFLSHAIQKGPAKVLRRLFVLYNAAYPQWDGISINNSFIVRSLNRTFDLFLHEFIHLYFPLSAEAWRKIDDHFQRHHPEFISYLKNSGYRQQAKWRTAYAEEALAHYLVTALFGRELWFKSLSEPFRFFITKADLDFFLAEGYLHQALYHMLLPIWLPLLPAAPLHAAA